MRARLTIEDGNAFPKEWLLDGQSIVKIGRHKENDLVLRDDRASRSHAEIYRERDHWLLRPLQTTNPTYLNGERVDQPVALEHNCEIRISRVVIRFAVEPAERPTDEIPILDLGEALSSESSSSSGEDSVNDRSSLNLQPDALGSLLSFMDASLRQDTSAGVIAWALRTLHRQTHASVCGFLGLDEDDPLPKMVLPSQSRVDVQLSRKLTQRALQDSKPVWLGNLAASNALQTDSLVFYRDALCVLVRSGEVPLGTLHVYRSDSKFEPREVQFCEALARYLGRCLYILRSRRALEADNSRLREHTSAAEPDLVGDSPRMRLLKQQISKLAEGPKIIRIFGESGSGKELVALSLHRLSRRSKGPLVTVNCAAIAATIPEAELFGHRKGSFTGADETRPGLFQQADMGTLFLDEIGELSEDCQAKLLRVLDGGTFRTVGGIEELKADVRIVAATNRDLQHEYREGRFRKDLYYRMEVEIRVPPLREHREDIPALVEHFLGRLAGEYRRAVYLSPKALERLQEYHWPGNVRQLRSVLEYAVAMSDGPIVGPDDLHLLKDPSSSVVMPEELSLNLEELERWAIRQALLRTHGTIVQAAKLLNIHRDTLMAKMKKYGIGNPKHDH
jgi:Nif-specific regulatory protein